MKKRLFPLLAFLALACLPAAAQNTMNFTFSVPGHVAKQGVFVSLIGQNVGNATSGSGPWVYASNSANTTIASTLKTLTTNTTGNAPNATIPVQSVQGFPSTGGNLLVSLPGQQISVTYNATNNSTNEFTGVTFANPQGPGIAANATVTLADNILGPVLTVNSTVGFPTSGVVMLQPAPGSVVNSYNIIASYNGTTSTSLLSLAPFPSGGNFSDGQFLASGGPVVLLASPSGGSMSVVYASAAPLWNSTQSNGANTPPVNLFPDPGSYSDNATYNATITMPDYATQGIQSGVAVIGVGGAVPIAAQDASGTLGSPSVGSALDVVFAIFEWGLVNSASGLDFDVSEVDQVGFPFTVNTVGNPPPPPADPVLGVGLLQDRETLFASFKNYIAALPGASSRTAFAQCNPDNPDAPYPENTRITAPQDITGIFLASAPVASSATPTGTGTAASANITAYYAVTAVSSSRSESAISQAISGFVGSGSNSTMQVTWQPYDYATGYNLYWSANLTTDGSNLLVAPVLIATTTGAGNTTFLDTNPGSHTGTTATPPTNNYGYTPLNSYLDAAIKDFYDYYTPSAGNQTFVLDDQGTFTKWTGHVVPVNMNGVTYRMLQLTGGVGQWGNHTSSPRAQIGKTLCLVEPFFSSNTGNSSHPAPPIVIPSGVNFASLQSAQLPYINTGTIVIDQNGGLWSYNGSGNKTSQGSYTSTGNNTYLAGMSLDPTQTPTAMAFGAQGVFGNFVGNGTRLDMANAKNAYNSIVTAIVRGLTPRSSGGNWTNTILPDYWSNQPVIQPATQSTGGNLTANGTFRYTVTAVGVLGDNSTRETPESSPATVYLGASNQTIAVNWTAVNPPGGPVGAPTAYSFNIYRSQLVSGNWTAPGYVGTVNNSPSSVFTFTDNGSTSPGAAPSVVWYAPGSLCDHYAGFFKQPSVSINGLSYGYAYDDKGNTSTNVQMNPADVTNLVITLNPWTAAPLPPGLPTITVNGGLNPFTTTNGTASAAQAFTASGSSLLGSILVTAPAGFELSTTGNDGFLGNLTLTPTSGTVSLTSIYARIAASAGIGSLSGNITLSSANATTQNVAVTGNITSSTGTPYQDWVSYWTTQSASFNGTSTNGTADPDGDGYVNDTEFAFDGNPTVPTATLLTTSTSAGNMTVSFIVRNTTPAGASYQVQETTNLNTGFVLSNATVSVSNDQTGILAPLQYQRRQFTVPMADPKKFYRVHATPSGN
jgi:hypothetical protein